MNIEEQKFLFGGFFLFVNKLQVKGDQLLSEDGLTTRQWFLTVMILQFENPPTLGEVSKLMGSSHQNVKQIALKLAEKGFLTLKKDENDGRMIRLHVTEKSHQYWQEREEVHHQFIRNLFSDLNENEVNILSVCLKKLLKKVE